MGTHSLRKTFGYILYQSDQSIELIQKFLNHSSPAITLAYIGITQDDMDEAILSMNI
ncbi:MAG: tyrosine-type recombinase/integrase [Synergistaceae bacterium]|nr:tyrosine-type recombinase/integrase [Synergistaceae bacterium]